MSVNLYPYQKGAIKKLKTGSILCGGVGSGKSRTAIAYYFTRNGGVPDGEQYEPMNDPPKDLYIITTARKRDTLEWDGELSPFLLSRNRDNNLYSNTVIVDSWNNITKYQNVVESFFIFDEQRVVGKGTWVKTFLKITKNNDWILLSATPGDTWQDYIPVFVANGFYKNRTDFTRQHIRYKSFTRYPQISHYVSTKKLEYYRDKILVTMDYKRETTRIFNDIWVDYDISAYKDLMRRRWNIWEDKPIENATEFCYSLRKIVNSAEARQLALLDLVEHHPKSIIFYNFDYELEILRELPYGLDFEIAEWNGHRHEKIPSSDKWVYLVQYSAGAEGWNCVETDTIIFYSQNYSYKTFKQACGRIDRLNTPFANLYYYRLKSKSGIDIAINRALKEKKNFNERIFTKGKYRNDDNKSR